MENIIVYQTEICSEELEVESNVKYHAQKTGMEMKMESVWGSTIVHVDDMPYDPFDYIPANFSGMRNKTRDIKVRELLSVPQKGQMPFPDLKEATFNEGTSFVPKLTDFGFSESEAS